MKVLLITLNMEQTLKCDQGSINKYVYNIIN